MTFNRRINVLHFSNAPVRYGAEENMLMLLTRLDRSRFRPILAAHPQLTERFGRDLPADVDTFPIMLEGPSDVGGAWHLVSLLRKHEIDIVHSHMFQASRLASPLAWVAGVRVRVETPHVREHWRHGWIKGSFVVDRLVGRFVTQYIACSNANREYLVREKRLPASKVVVVRYGIPLERLTPNAGAPAEIRRSLGIAENAPIIGVLARFEPQKGHRILLDAWQSVIRSFPEARLILLGEGSLREQIRSEVARLHLDSSVVFAGYQSNVADWLAFMDFTVLPSFYEGLPLAAIESLAAERAVVASAVDGTPEAVVDGKTGLLVPPGEPGPLSAAISRLIASPELARDLGRAGRRLVEELFSEQRQVEETEALYEAALRQHLGSTLRDAAVSTKESQLG